MPITNTESGVIFEGPIATRLYQRIVVRHVLRQQQAGLRRGRRETLTRRQWAEHYGLNPKKATVADVIAKLEADIEDLQAKIADGS